MIIDGKKLSTTILKRVKEKIAHLKIRPVLAIILIGDNPASLSFIRQKSKACLEAGVVFNLHQFSEKIKEKDLIGKIKKICSDKKNHGIIIQLPIPKKFNTEKILNLIPLEKDIDALNNRSPNILSPVIGTVEEILKISKINPKSKNIVIVGSGRLVGIPIIRWLKGQKITPIVLNKYSKNIASFTRQADILISGVGKANLITPTMIKNGAVCIDFGFSKKNKKISGDFSQDVAKKAGVFTPTPGGTGPLTVAELIVNLLTLLRVFPCHIE